MSLERELSTVITVREGERYIKNMLFFISLILLNIYIYI
jgi:hypothetical protein